MHGHLPDPPAAALPPDFPLSGAQRGIWLGQSLSPGSPCYNVGRYLEIRGAIDPAMLAMAIRTMVRDIDCLRIRLRAGPSAPSQYFSAADDADVPLHDYAACGKSAAEAVAWMRQDIARPFDLTTGPLFRFAVFRIAPDRFFLYEVNHHLINDAAGSVVAERHMVALYNGLAGCTSDAPPAPHSFLDILSQEQAYLASRHRERDRDYWHSILRHRPEAVTLSGRPPAWPGPVHETGGIITPSTERQLRQFAALHGASLPAAILALTALYMCRMTGAGDLVLGMPVAARPPGEARNAAGLASNVVPLRLHVDIGAPFADLLRQAGRRLRQALRHQRYPAGALRQDLGLNPNQPDIYGTVVNFIPAGGDLSFAGHPVRKHHLDNWRVEDLLLVIHAGHQDAGLRVSFIANQANYPAAALHGHAARFLHLARIIASAPGCAVGDLDILLPGETAKLLHRGIETELPPEPATLPGLFEAQAERTPNAVAIVADGCSLTYAALNRSANVLAHRLIARGLGPEILAGLCVDRSIETIIGLLAILKAGGGYVPLDPAYPPARLHAMLNDARPLLVLGRRETGGSMPADIAFVPLAETGAGAGEEAAKNPTNADRRMALTPAHAAYVIYTSGSSGTPKGVTVTHAGMAALAASHIRQLSVTAQSRVLQFASLNFDSSVADLAVAFGSGAALVLAPSDALSGSALRRVLVAQRITHATLPPAVLATLEPGADLALQCVAVAGEACPPALAAAWCGHQRMINAYGPTEATVCITLSAALQGASAPIGRPIAGTRVYVLDATLHPAPDGVAGELYIAGASLARGYLNRPGMTAQRFVADPFGPPGSRMYRTGDLARWNAAGELDYLGRADAQVKLRGFRIEPGEIEAALAAQPGIRQAAVVARNDAPGGRYLAAYIVPDAGLPQAGTGPHAARLRQALAAILPSHMIPAAFVFVPAFTLLANGKLDRLALPAPGGAARGAAQFEPPEGPVETALAALWSELLGAADIGRQDNFFERGGQSLLVVTLIERLRRLGWHADARAVLTQPTLAGLAATLTQAAPAEVPASRIAAASARITPDMLPLITLQQPQIDAIAAAIPGGASNIQDIYPLAPLQEGILFQHLMAPDDDTYVLRVLLSVASRAMLDTFMAALQQVIDRHDVLRTAIFWHGLPEPLQVVCRGAAMRVDHVTLQTGAAAETAWNQLAQSGRLDIGAAPLIRAVAAPDPAGGNWLVMLLAHHIVIDHTTLESIIGEVGVLLSAGGCGLPAPVPFRNFVHAARGRMRRADHDDFFRAMLGDVEDATVPFGRQAAPDPVAAIEEARLPLGPALSQFLRATAHRSGVSPASLFHLAWALVLARTSGRADVVFGTVLLGRMASGTGTGAGTGTGTGAGIGEDVAMGLFMNTLPLRVAIDERPVCRALQETHASLAALLDHEHASLAQAQRCSAVPAGQPVFTALLNYRHMRGTGPGGRQQDAAWAGLRVLRVEERTHYRFGMSVDDDGDDIALVAQAQGDIMPAQLCQLMCHAAEHLALALCHAPGTELRLVEVLAPFEHDRVLRRRDATVAPDAITFPALFEAQVGRTPDAVAVVAGEASLSYAQLNRRANNLAHRLIAAGVGPETIAGLCVDRGIETIICLLAILKAGGAYVPLDPAQPPARLRAMLDEARPMAVLGSRETCARMPPEVAGLLIADAIAAQSSEHADINPTDAQRHRRLMPDNIAYVIYTSGSAGAPKGVAVTHAGIAALAISHIGRLRVTPQSRLLQLASLNFDVSFMDLAVAFGSGATLVLTPQDALSGAALRRVLVSQRITHVAMPPAVLATIPPGGDDLALESLVVGGEPCPPELTADWCDRQLMINAYGPTESTVCVTLSATLQGMAGARFGAIGTPIPGARVYVLDAALNPVPDGAPGELYIAGAGLARGYLNRPGLTAERFVADPHGLPGSRMYRSGDLARWNNAGNLEFLGRTDRQIKLRGLRIEPGEIEAALMARPGIGQAAVIARHDPPGGQYLAAYIVPEPGAEPDMAGLRQALAAILPSHMIPAAFVCLPGFALTPNGKLDRRALPPPTQAADEVAQTATEAPQTPTEAALADIWRRVLRRAAIGRSDDFFARGGHSLTALQMIADIRSVFQVELPLRMIFDTRTIAGLARQIDDSLRDLRQAPRIPPIEPRQDTGLAPLSHSQERMWLIQSLYPASTAYNMAVALKLSGALDIAAMRRAFDELYRRHDMLRSSISLAHGQPAQSIAAWRPDILATADLRGHGEQAWQSALAAAETDARTPFSLAGGPVMRATLSQTGAEQHLLTMTLHHIAGDQWSLGVLGRELASLYNAFRAGQPGALGQTAISYLDYAAWQRSGLLAAEFARQLEYWRQTLANLPVLDLPTDRPRPALPTLAGAVVQRPIAAALTAQLEQLAYDGGATLFMVMLAAFGVLLHRITLQDDIAVAVPVANRLQSATESLVGTFVNTLVLRMDLSGQPTFGECLNRVRTIALDAFSHQDISFDRLVQDIAQHRDRNRPPLAQVLFNDMTAPMHGIELDGLRWDPVILDRGGAQFDLSFSIDSHITRTISIEYSTDLFDRATIDNLADAYLTLLAGIAAAPQTQIAVLPVLPRGQITILQRWNETATPAWKHDVFVRAFEAQAALTPDARAISFQDQSISYAGLNATANAIARRLRALGVRRGGVVAICLPRTPGLLAALLAVQKSGAAYVPLDPEFPPDRLHFMLTDSGAGVLVTSGGIAEFDSPAGVRQLDLADDRAAGASTRESDQEAGPTPQDIAYVIYTSGTTGRPKGVAVPHGALLNLLGSMRRSPGLSAGDIMAAVTTISFDIAGLELYLPLLAGACVELVPRPTAQDGPALARLLATSGATIMQATPATWHMLIEAGWQGGPQFRALCGGEPLSPDLARQLLQRAGAVWNMYGPTETTIWSTTGRLDARDTEISIGRPIANTQIHILDPSGGRMPIGARGEICIGGAGVAAGYAGRPALTASRFVTDPFSAEPGARLYRTGDLGYWRADGTLMHAGRLDDQLKIRGFRIEPAEIETVLRGHGAVSQAAVMARQAQPGDPRLVAYVVYRRGEDLTSSDIRRYLRQSLPGYMVPSIVMALESLPLAPNGKLDRAALPDPFATAQGDAGHDAPHAGMETVMAGIWRSILRVDRIAAEANFFDLGGHSLLALRVARAVKKQTGARLDPRILYFHNLRQVAALVEQQRHGGGAGSP